jgi:hypothetical protein
LDVSLFKIYGIHEIKGTIFIAEGELSGNAEIIGGKPAPVPFHSP